MKKPKRKHTTPLTPEDAAIDHRNTQRGLPPTFDVREAAVSDEWRRQAGWLDAPRRAEAARLEFERQTGWFGDRAREQRQRSKRK